MLSCTMYNMDQLNLFVDVNETHVEEYHGDHGVNGINRNFGSPSEVARSILTGGWIGDRVDPRILDAVYVLS